MKVNTTHN